MTSSIDVSDCPPDADLELFVHGKISTSNADQLIAHIDGCESCQSRVTSIELQNPVLEDLRNVVASDSEMRPSSSQTSDSASDFGHDFEQIGPYQILDVIDHGAMGVVYRVRHEHLNRVLAMKVIRRELIDRQEITDRFSREAKSVGSLIHPNIVQATDAGVEDDVSFLVMEYLEGRNLSELIRREGPLSPHRASDLIRQAATGLQYAHDHGFVHRDVKPSNLMLTDAGDVKLLDLGLAALKTTPEGDRTMTNTLQMLGTADYMSPEQIENSHEADARSDIYSLGATFQFLLTGIPLYPASEYSSLRSLLNAHVEEPSKPLVVRRPDLSSDSMTPGVQKIVDRMLTKRIDDRFQSMSSVIDAVSELIAAPETGTAKPDANRSLVGWRVGAVAVISLLLIGIYASIRSNGENELTKRQSLLNSGATAAQLSQADFRLATERIRSGKSPDGIALLCRALQTDPENYAAAQSLYHELAYRDELGQPPSREPLQPKRLKHNGPLGVLLFDDTGEKLVSITDKFSNYVWNVSTGETLMGPMNLPMGLIPCARAGPLTAFVREETKFSFANSESLTIMLSGIENPAPYAQASLTSDGEFLLVGGLDGSVHLWSVATQELVHRWDLLGAAVSLISVTGDDERAAIAGEDGQAAIIDLKSGDLVAKMEHDGPVRWIQFSPDESQLATGATDSAIHLWNSADGSPVFKPLKHQGETVRFKNINSVFTPITGRFRDQLMGPLRADPRDNGIRGDGSMFGAFSADGSRLVSAGASDHAVEIWDTQTGERTHEPLVHPAPILCLGTDKRGSRMATGTSAGNVRIWSLETGELVCPILKLPSAVMWVSFSPTLNQFVACDDQGLCHVFDIAPPHPRVPTWFLPLAESYAGKRYNSRGVMESVPLDDFIKQVDQTPPIDETSSDEVLAGQFVGWLNRSSNSQHQTPFRETEGTVEGKTPGSSTDVTTKFDLSAPFLDQLRTLDETGESNEKQDK